MQQEQGLRFNDGKTRYDLLAPFAIDQVAKVCTIGAQKYAERNWEKGMKWSKVIASLKRHLAAIESGEDFDKETSLLHSAHVMWNAMALTEYYKSYPEGDDRPHKYLNPKRVALDIDDVLADWVGPFCELTNIPRPKTWHFGFTEKIDKLLSEGFDYVAHMENLPVLTKPEDIPFEPYCYITSRSHTEPCVAVNWLAKNGFAQVPVIQTNDKIKACKENEIDYFIDDRYETFVNLNKNGICCFLFDAPHNQRYDVGYRRIKDFKDFYNRFLK